MASIDSPGLGESSEGDAGDDLRECVQGPLTSAKIKELFDNSLQCKEVGLGAYKVNNYKKAIECWSTASDNLKELIGYGPKESVDSEHDVTMSRVMEMQLVVSLNLAQAHLKESNFSQALSFCETALAQDPKNVKALYRKASAQLMASDFSGSRKTLAALLEGDTQNDDARRLLVDVDRKERLSQKEARKAAARMFSGIEPDPRSLQAGSVRDELEYEEAIFEGEEGEKKWSWKTCCRRWREHNEQQWEARIKSKQS